MCRRNTSCRQWYDTRYSFGHIRCLNHCVGESFQNVFFYVSGVIDIIYIYKLSKKISYHNFLVRKKRIIIYKLFFFIFININFLSLYWKNLFFHIIFYTTCIIINLFIKYIKSYTFIKINSSTILFIYS